LPPRKPGRIGRNSEMLPLEGEQVSRSAAIDRAVLLHA
jgi:hypothetical protein